MLTNRQVSWQGYYFSLFWWTINSIFHKPFIKPLFTVAKTTSLNISTLGRFLALMPKVSKYTSHLSSYSETMLFAMLSIKSARRHMMVIIIIFHTFSLFQHQKFTGKFILVAKKSKLLTKFLGLIGKNLCKALSCHAVDLTLTVTADEVDADRKSRDWRPGAVRP